jgi:hypothetical protein
MTGDVIFNDTKKVVFGTGGASTDAYQYWNESMYFFSSNYFNFMDLDSHKQFETTATGVNIPSGKTYQINDKNLISDSVYAADWNGNHAYTASKDAIYDIIQTIVPTNSVVTYFVHKTYSADSLKYAYERPLTLIPAPGNGYIIVIDYAMSCFRVNYVSSAFTSCTLFVFCHGSDPDINWMTALIPAVLSKTSTTIGRAEPANSGDSAYYNNASILLRPSVDITTGNGSLDIYVSYRIVAL